MSESSHIEQCTLNDQSKSASLPDQPTPVTPVDVSAASSSTWTGEPHQVICHYKDQLISALSQCDPIIFAKDLLSKGLVPKRTCDGMMHDFQTRSSTCEQATVLVNAIQIIIEIAPQRFYEILNILSEHERMTDIVNMLRSTTGASTQQNQFGACLKQNSISKHAHTTSDLEEISTVSHASSGSTEEPYKILLHYEGKLISALSLDPLGVAEVLVAKGLIPDSIISEEMQHWCSNCREQATVLVNIIKIIIEIAPKRFYEFLNILFDSEQWQLYWMRDMAEILRSSIGPEHIDSNGSIMVQSGESGAHLKQKSNKEADSEEISDATSGLAEEPYKVILHYNDKLISALSLSPIRIAEILLAKGLIPENIIYEEMQHRCSNCREQATILVNAIKIIIEIAPQRFYEFLNILSELQWMRDMTEILQLSIDPKHIRINSSGSIMVQSLTCESGVHPKQKSNSEADSEEISDATSGLTEELYEVILHYNDKLISALSLDPMGIARILLAKELISESTEAQLLQCSTPLEKATILVTSVRKCIKIIPKQFHEFLRILSKQIWMKDITEILRSSIGPKHIKTGANIQPDQCLEQKSISELAHTAADLEEVSSGSTEELYQVILRYNNMLVCAFSIDPLCIAHIFLAKGLIPNHLLEEIQHSCSTCREQANILVKAIRVQIEVAPEQFYELLNIFSEQRWMRDIVNTLQSADVDMQKNQCLEQNTICEHSHTASDSEEISHASSEEPYQVMLRYNDKLISALSLDPMGIAGILLTKEMISESTEAKLLQCSTPLEKATILVSAVRQRIKSTPEQFHRFLYILSQGEKWTKNIIEILYMGVYTSSERIKTGANMQQNQFGACLKQDSISKYAHTTYNSREISTTSHASSDSTEEPYKIMLHHNDKLITALSFDPMCIAKSLLAKGLISKSTVKQLQQRSTPHEKATILIATVRQRIKIVPKQFHKFLDIISEEDYIGKDIMAILGDNLLTESDLQILNIILVEHLPMLKERGLNLSQGDHNMSFITKKEVIKCLQQIGQHTLGDILNKVQGVKHLQDYVFNSVYQKALQDEKYRIKLQVFRMVLCGAPRSGKTTFWKRLALKGFEPSELSPSTGAAESYFLSAQTKKTGLEPEVHMHTEMLFDLQLYSEDRDLDREALTIYKHILEMHKPQTPEIYMNARTVKLNSVQSVLSSKNDEISPLADSQEDHLIQDDIQAAFPADNHLIQSDIQAAFPADNQKDHLIQSDIQAALPVDSQEDHLIQNNIQAALPINEPLEIVSKKDIPDPIIVEIDKCFKELNDLLQKGKKLPDIPSIKKVCHLQDTGGQRAFLELLPTISVGKALYLLFFNYKDFRTSVSETVQMEGSSDEVPTGAEYEQIDVIMQSLICVSTTSNKQCDNVALLIGTHVDEVQQEDVSDVNHTIYERVKPFLKSTLVYAESGDEKKLKEKLVLKVAIKQNNLCNHEPKYYQNVVMNIVESKLCCHESEELPASWYMFSIILRRLQSAGHCVLQYRHCQCIANRLYINESMLRSLLSRLHKVFGIVMYFPEVKGLEDVVICDPAFVYESISKLIFKSFDDCINAPLSLKLKKWGMFKYQELERNCKIKMESHRYFDIDKLIILLKHLGIIAPVQDYAQSSEAVHLEYLIPCVLKDAKGQDLKVQIQDTQACSIVPLRIYFECEFAPMGGFCYLFTKLMSKWKLCSPDELADENNIYWRNKVTFKVGESYFVTLLSTDKYYEIHIIHCESEPFQVGEDGHTICIYVWSAIRTILENSPNELLQTYKTGCICTINHQNAGQHVMKFNCKPHESVPQVKALCARNNTVVKLKETQPSVIVWFKQPKILIEGKPGKKVHLCVKDLLLKVSDGRESPKCEWWCNGEKIEADDEHYNCNSDKNTFELTILHFDSQLKGKYECIVSTAEEPTLSTAVEVIVESVELDGNYGVRKVKAGGQEFKKEPRRQSSNSVEYQTLILCTSKLRTAVSSDLIRLSGCLLAKGLISRDNDSELRNKHTEVADRAARLVELIQQRVTVDPHNYIKFIDVLKDNHRYYSDIVQLLSDTYSSLVTPVLTPPIIKELGAHDSNTPAWHTTPLSPDHKDSTSQIGNVETESTRIPLQDAPTKHAKLQGRRCQFTTSKAFLLATSLVLILSMAVHYYLYKTDSQATQEHEKSTQPIHAIVCSWDEFKQTAQLTGIDNLNNLRWSVEEIGNWQSLCLNLNLNTADMNRILNDRDHPIEECLRSYFNSDKGSWEEVVIAVARPSVGNKRTAIKIAKKRLHSPNKERILSMLNDCETYD